MVKRRGTCWAMLLCCLWGGLAYAGSAEDAWHTLVGERFLKRPEFAYVQNNPALPNVLMYGDSISIHYTQHVRTTLKDQANVYRLYCNGGDSSAFIPKMNKMHDAMRDEQLDHSWTFKWDVIHFNVGLHDLKYLSGKKLDKENGQQVSSLDEYKTNLRSIILYLKQTFPYAKLVFATTTPVPEGAAGRFAGDAEIYNKAALEVIFDYSEIQVNDLFSFSKPKQSVWWVMSGDVHYNTTGSNAQGDEVARVILGALSTQK